MRPARTRTPRSRIAIVGAGFAGLAAAQRLGREFDVTVIDRSPWFEWRPNIHELLSGVKRPADLRLPTSHLVARAGHRLVRATVTALDAAAGRLTTPTGRHVDFDACIVAVGGVHETSGVAGADRHAMPFKSVDDCASIARRLALLARERGDGSIVIVGGGLEGIEALGEILRRYRERAGLNITVVEAGARLLPGMPASMETAVRRHCANLDVRFLTRSRVTGVMSRRVRLQDGTVLRSDLTIWTAGASAPPLLSESGLADELRQWAPVNRTLRSRRFDNVFVIGDAAGLPRALDKQAFYALQMGELAAGNVRRALAGRSLRDFVPSRKPMLVAFGDLDTFLVAGHTVVASPALAALKEAVFQVTMAQIDPPRDARGLKSMSARLDRAVRHVALPTLAASAARVRRRR